MSTLRFTDPAHWSAIEDHLRTAKSERFAFAFTRLVDHGSDGPVMSVEGIELVADADVTSDRTGWSIKDTALDTIHNRAITERRGIVEFHNHQFGPPGFSRTDEASLGPMAAYIIEILEGRPYAAAVWAEGAVYAEWFAQRANSIERGQFRTVTVLDIQFKVLNTSSAGAREERFDRQIPIVGEHGQATIRALRVAIVGTGGTGSHAVTSLGYLGVRDFVLLEDDTIDLTNLNRTVTAGRSDVGTGKADAAQARLLSIDPGAKIKCYPALTARDVHSELLQADVIIGCVDHDGPRHRLNQLALKTGVPYIDIATGVDTEVDPPAIGGRIRFVVPGGPCLGCTEELDPVEVGRWYKTDEGKRLDREHGYGLNDRNPSVVHLNGLAVNVAVAELVAWIAGARRPALRLDVDLQGDPATPGVRVLPSGDRQRKPGCIECAWRYELRSA